MQICIQIHVLCDAQIFVESETLRHIADSILNLLRMRSDIDAQNHERSALGTQQARDQPHQGGLAGAVRTHQCGQFAVTDFE